MNFSRANFLNEVNKLQTKEESTDSVNESVKVNEARANTAKAALTNASDALTKSIGGQKLNKSYVKDYLKSLERMARKAPGLFVKQYGDFSINDYIEDVEYNMANESESVNEATNTMPYRKARKLTAKDPGLVSDIKSDMTALRLKLGLDNDEKEWLSYIVTLATYGVGQGVWDEGSNESLTESKAEEKKNRKVV